MLSNISRCGDLRQKKQINCKDDWPDVITVQIIKPTTNQKVLKDCGIHATYVPRVRPRYFLMLHQANRKVLSDACKNLVVSQKLQALRPNFRYAKTDSAQNELLIVFTYNFV